MAESRGRPGSHGPGGRNSNNNGNGNQGPGSGGGGKNDPKKQNKSKPNQTPLGGLSIPSPSFKSKPPTSTKQKKSPRSQVDPFAEEEDEDLAPNERPTVQTPGGAAVDKVDTTAGFTPAKTPTKDWMDKTQFPGGPHSSEAQAAYNEDVRGANNIGTAPDGPEASQGQKDLLAALNKIDPEEARAAANDFASDNNKRTLGGRVKNGLSIFGNKAFPGINSIPSYGLTDENLGTYGSFDSYSPTEQVLSFLGKSRSPIAGGLSALSGIAGEAGFSPHKSYSSFRPEAQSNTERRGNDRQRAALGKDLSFGKGGITKPVSLFERAQQTLYPQQEERRPLLGVGVSQGKSTVRKAPTLSVLNVRRAKFGRR